MSGSSSRVDYSALRTEYSALVKSFPTGFPPDEPCYFFATSYHIEITPSGRPSWTISEQIMIKLVILFFGLLNFTLASEEAVKAYCFDVEGMTCGKCVSKVHEAFEKVKTVSHSKVSLNDATVMVFAKSSFTPSDEKTIEEVFKKLNYKAKRIKCASSI
jgi:copper chaperone CopZ